MTTPHSHTVVFGRKVDGCPRCDELKAGAAPVQWRGQPTKFRQLRAEHNKIERHHNCRTANCGPVCTFGDW